MPTNAGNWLSSRPMKKPTQLLQMAETWEGLAQREEQIARDGRITALEDNEMRRHRYLKDLLAACSWFDALWSVDLT
jgi:hypothetical protein